MSRFTVLVLALVAVLLSGCAQVAQQAVQQATGVQVDQKGDQISVKGQNGDTLTMSSETPAELKDFPIPSGFKLDSSGSMTTNGDKVSVANYKGTGSLQSVADFYQKSLPSLGWKEEGNFMTDTGGMINFSKGDTDGLTVTISKEGDNLDVSVLFGKTKTPAAGQASQSTGSASTTSSDATPTAKPTAQAEAKPTEKPAATEAPATPELAAPGSIPAELKDLPMPAGFALAKDGTLRIAQGGTFKSATARFVGNAPVKDAGDFFQKNLPAKGWTEDQFVTADDAVMGLYTNDAAGTNLMVSVSKGDSGTEVVLALTKQ